MLTCELATWLEMVPTFSWCVTVFGTWDAQDTSIGLGIWGLPVVSSICFIPS